MIEIRFVYMKFIKWRSYEHFKKNEGYGFSLPWNNSFDSLGRQKVHQVHEIILLIAWGFVDVDSQHEAFLVLCIMISLLFVSWFVLVSVHRLQNYYQHFSLSKLIPMIHVSGMQRLVCLSLWLTLWPLLTSQSCWSP